MATQWVLDKVSNALAPTVSNTVATAGSFAGGAVSAVGNSINGVGQGINNSIKRYGDGVMDYGNGILDWTSASGVRGQTASNPLGLAGGKASGKASVTSPKVYSAPQKSTPSQKLLTTGKTQKKIDGTAPKKAVPVANKKAVAPVKKSTPAGPVPVKKAASTPLPKTSSAPNPGALRKPAGATNTPAASTKKVTPVKASTATVTKKAPARARVDGNSTAAANPLGLSF